MGGTLIKQILLEGKEQITGEELLVLQPNVGEATLRKYLVANGYTIISEEILEENKKIYEILVAEKTQEKVTYSEKELMFGPHLLNESNEVFLNKWQRELKQRQTILQQLAHATNQQARKERMESEIKMIEEVLG